MTFLVIIDTTEWTYYSHHVFANDHEASAFKDGMEAAWKISHGYYNCWQPFILTYPNNVDELRERGTSFASVTDESLRLMLQSLELM